MAGMVERFKMNFVFKCTFSVNDMVCVFKTSLLFAVRYTSYFGYDGLWNKQS